jgi:hypothetical protein
MAQNPGKTVNFNNAMTDLSQGDSAAVTQSYDFSVFEHIVDVAGGHGTLLAAILDQAPKLRGTLVEMPHVIEGAKKAGILDRFANRSTLEAVNILESVPAGADAYIMKSIIHDWYDPECIKILSGCRKGIRPGGRLLVVDQVVPAGNEPAMSKIVDLEMLVLPGGMERTEKEFRELFAASGFRLERIVPTPGILCIIEGVPV